MGWKSRKKTPTFFARADSRVGHCPDESELSALPKSIPVQVNVRHADRFHALEKEKGLGDSAT
jgi:hypothetical protein